MEHALRMGLLAMRDGVLPPGLATFGDQGLQAGLMGGIGRPGLRKKQGMRQGIVGVRRSGP